MTSQDDDTTPHPLALLDSARTKYTLALGRLRRGPPELALLSLHGSVEDVLRAHGLRLGLPAAYEPFPALVAALTTVSQAPLSPAEAEGVRRMHRLRGRIAHGEQVVVAGETIDAYRRLAARLLPRYGVLVTPPEEPAAEVMHRALTTTAGRRERAPSPAETTALLGMGGSVGGAERVAATPPRERTVYPDAELARYLARARPSRATSELPLARQLNAASHRRGASLSWAGGPAWLLPVLIVLSIFLVGTVISISLQQRGAASVVPTAVLATAAGWPAGTPQLTTAAPPGEARPGPGLAPGQIAYVRGDIELLRVLAQPGESPGNPLIYGLGPGSAVTVVGGPVELSGETWWQIQSPLGEGWCVGQYLEVRG